MATITPAFQNAYRQVHCEHEQLLQSLKWLDAALDELVSYSEVYANLAPLEKLREHGRLLAQMLPEHFDREEASMHGTVAKVSPELAEFACEMQRQHQHLRASLMEFCRSVEYLETTQDLDDSIWKVKQQGKLLTCAMMDHIKAEEEQLSGFF